MTSGPSWRQDLIWRAEAVGFDVATALLRLLPVDWVSGLGAGLFKALGPLTGSHRIAERITVMVNGAVIFSGAPAAVRSSRSLNCAASSLSLAISRSRSSSSSAADRYPRKPGMVRPTSSPPWPLTRRR